ncbi:MAG TPA: DUF3108 domain-containing protein [Bryobacteraceae bacterium]|nr:DUF3108 domain-containing protein [Bryobacteraceae bacterium]
MNRLYVLLPALAAAVASAHAAEPQPASDRSHYTINWPSGLNLGEATLTLTKTVAAEGKPAELRSELTIDASIPGFGVTDRYTARASADYCSAQFDKKLRHGARHADEQLTFDQEHMTVTRETLTAEHEHGEDLGKSDASAPACAKDALTFLAFLRHDLAEGRLPQQQPVFFGAAYDVKVDFRGTETLKVGETSMQADHVDVTLKGPASDISLVIFFAKDAGRTPVVFRVPLALGTFSMELAKP